MIRAFVIAATLLPTPAQRRELAGEIFQYLYKHCNRDEAFPADYCCDECYQLHLAAKRLYNLSVPAGAIDCPVSDFTHGAYQPYDFPACPLCPNYLAHEVMMGHVTVRIPKCRP